VTVVSLDGTASNKLIAVVPVVTSFSAILTIASHISMLDRFGDPSISA